jgi:hypothetical protein
MSDWQKTWEQQRQEKYQQAKDDLYAKLAQHPEITQIVVEYNGAGDDGNIEETSFLKGEEVVEVPQSLQEAADEYVWQALEHYKGGWEINDGSFGTVTIDVANKKASFDHNENYTESRSEPFED